MLKSPSGWSSNGSNAYDFSALPAGYRYYQGGFDDVGNGAYFWSATVDNNYYGIHLNGFDKIASFLEVHNKDYGYSVRCVKDE